jgi:hypothetical protein
MAINDKDFYASHGLNFDIEKMQIEYTKRVINQAKIEVLTELKSEIEEIKPLEPTDDEDWQCGCFHGLELMQDKCLKLIQEKINNLKEYD